MSAINLSGNASGSGTFTIASPNSNTSYTLALPEEAGTITTSNSPYSTFRNRIINGDMRIDQRNAGASVTAGATDAYCLDRYQYGASQASKYTVQQSSTAPIGFTNSLLVTSSSAYSVLTNDFFRIVQKIEGFNTADLMWGTANAKTVTLSFWVRSSLTGTFGGSMMNSAGNRSYPFTYSISAADTWEYKTVTVAGDTSGTWLTTNGIGINVQFGLGVGSTYSGTAGAWAGALYVSATGATSVVGTNGATFYITGVQLEVGSVATPFERRPYGTELSLCQRYYQFISSTPAIAFSTTDIQSRFYFSQMRTTPSATVTAAVAITDVFNSNYTQSSASITGVSGTAYAATANFGNFTGLTSSRFYFTNFTGGLIALSAEL